MIDDIEEGEVMEVKTGSKTSRLRSAFMLIGALALAGCKPTITFTALESTIVEGNSTTLEWDVEFPRGASVFDVELKPDNGVVDVEGSLVVTPTETTTYTLATRSSVFGFPMFIDEEVTVEVKDGDLWDFSDSVGVGDWAFGYAGYSEDDFEDYTFLVGESIVEPVEGIQAAQFKVTHVDEDDVSEPVIVYSKVRKLSLEDDTDYKISVSVNYSIGTHRDITDTDCTKPTVKLSAYTSLEEPVNEVDEEDFVSLANVSEEYKRDLSTDLTIVDDTCADDVFEISSASTGENPISIKTDSDGALWLTIAIEVSKPELDVYIKTVSAFFEEQ